MYKQRNIYDATFPVSRLIFNQKEMARKVKITGVQRNAMKSKITKSKKVRIRDRGIEIERDRRTFKRN